MFPSLSLCTRCYQHLEYSSQYWPGWYFLTLEGSGKCLYLWKTPITCVHPGSAHPTPHLSLPDSVPSSRAGWLLAGVSHWGRWQEARRSPEKPGHVSPTSVPASFLGRGCGSTAPASTEGPQPAVWETSLFPLPLQSGHGNNFLPGSRVLHCFLFGPQLLHNLWIQSLH